MKLFNTKQTKTKIILFSFALLFLSFNSVNTIRRRDELKDVILVRDNKAQTNQNLTSQIQPNINLVKIDKEVDSLCIIFSTATEVKSVNAFSNGISSINGKEQAVKALKLNRITGYQLLDQKIIIDTKLFRFELNFADNNNFISFKKSFVNKYLMYLTELINNLLNPGKANSNNNNIKTVKNEKILNLEKLKIDLENGATNASNNIFDGKTSFKLEINSEIYPLIKN